MTIDAKNKKDSSSETIPFDVSKLKTLQYIKVVYIDEDNELYEMNTDVQTINNDVIQLFVNGQVNVNITYPKGIVLKLITSDAIYFAKTILKDVKKINNRILLVMDVPKKTIRQQNRKHCRINLSRPCVLIVKDDKDTKQYYLSQSVNVSMGGILIHNTESMLGYDKVDLKFRKDDVCYILLFLEHDLVIKLKAKFVRSEYIDNLYRYAFEFIKIPEKDINPLNKFITNEQLKILKASNTKY